MRSLFNLKASFHSVCRTIILTSLSLVAVSAAADEVAPLDDESLSNKLQASEWVGLLQIESKNNLISVSQIVAPGVYTVQGYRYSAAVMRGFKGELGEEIKFQIDLSRCRALLPLDQQYLVFGSKDFQGNYQVEDCSDVIGYEKAKSFISNFDHAQEKNLLVMSQ